MTTWEQTDPGVLELPDGRRIRGRGLRRAEPGSRPDWGLYLTGRRPTGFDWDWRWTPWPDFRGPRDREDALDALSEAWRRTARQRVEIACGGGVGRTGTALACLGIASGLSPQQAIGYVRARYHPRAVETRAERRFIDWVAARQGPAA